MSMPIYSAPGGNVPAPPPPAPVNPQQNLMGDVEAMIEARVAAVEAKYAARVKQLEDQIAAGTFTAPASAVAAHAAGPGYETAPTWSQWLQELSRAGQLTEEILTAAGVIAKVV